MRLLLFPLFVKQIKSQREMQLLQPKIAELKVLYPDDRQKQSEAQMALFKEHGVNPFSGCLPLLVQLPVFFALFGVLHKFAPGKGGVYKGYAHLSAATVKDVATSKTFGVPAGGCVQLEQGQARQPPCRRRHGQDGHHHHDRADDADLPADLTPDARPGHVDRRRARRAARRPWSTASR